MISLSLLLVTVGAGWAGAGADTGTCFTASLAATTAFLGLNCRLDSPSIVALMPERGWAGMTGEEAHDDTCDEAHDDACDDTRML